MPYYHFDLGNSTGGPLGLTAALKADTPEAAVARFRDLLLGRDIFDGDEQPSVCVPIDGGFGEYVNLYCNLDAITVAAIDDEADSYERAEDKADLAVEAAVKQDFDNDVTLPWRLREWEILEEGDEDEDEE
jgi:hypothetical protein